MSELQIAMLLRAYHQAHHTDHIAFDVLTQTPERAAAELLRSMGYLIKLNYSRPYKDFYALTHEGTEFVEAHLKTKWHSSWGMAEWRIEDLPLTESAP